MPRIEAYMTEPRSLSIRDRLTFCTQSPDPNVGRHWLYDTYHFSAPLITGKDIIVQAVAQEEFVRTKEGGMTATIVAGGLGQRLGWFEEKTATGRQASIAGDEIIVITVGDITVCAAGIGFRSKQQTVYIEDLVVRPWGKSGLDWEFGYPEKGNGEYRYRSSGGFPVWAPLDQPLPPKIVSLRAAIEAAKEKLACPRCQSGNPLCLHWVH